jgi:hypothetical protein
MATKQQYDAFKLLFDEESDRERVLHDLSKLYISLVTFYSGFLIFVAKDLPPKQIGHWLLFAAATVCLLLAFVLSISAASIASYEAINDPDDVIDSFGTKPPSDADFLDQRIADLTVACNRNSLVNDRKAIKLQLAGMLLLFGITLHAAYFLAMVWPGSI